tara:strand:- start:559 stop:750 length:192 start_codon:yes stop_codon:yes gene_type:complete
MTGWDNDSVDRLNYSLMNLNDRLSSIEKSLEKRNEIAKESISALDDICISLQEISKSLKDNKK